MLKKFLYAILAVITILTVNTYAAEPEKAQTPPAVKKVKAASPKGTLPELAPFPALSDDKSWTMVIVPDIQTYIKQIENNGILDMMLAWIVRRSKEMKIQQVFFTGDLVYSNNARKVIQEKGLRFNRAGKYRDLFGEEQWQTTSRLLERLDGKVPYVLCTGNHDYGINSAENRETFFNKYFTVDRNPLTKKQLVECGLNYDGVKTLENSAYEFTAPQPDGRKFLIITLQFSPTDANLEWAKKLAAQPRFANHIGIVLTHSYLAYTGKHLGDEKYVISKKDGNSGEQIFKKLVFPSKNIRMVISGHIAKADSWKHSLAFSREKNCIGKEVVQMTFNPQAIGGGFSGNGGDGWLRLLEFMPDKKTVKATTFSPFFYGSTSTTHLAWKNDPANCFTFTLE